jgi:peroxiredoxin Q/BCP
MRFLALSYRLRNTRGVYHRRMAVHLQPGDEAPFFEGVDANGQRVALDDYRGRKLVLYFYPKDDTPHCTLQACSLRDRNVEIVARGAAVLGVSTQDAASHDAFTRKFALNFPLLADTQGRVARAYGAMGSGGIVSKLKAALGLADRITFIIDEAGRIAHVIRRPEVARHAQEVLERL